MKAETTAPQLGVWLGSGSVVAAEIAARSGFDVVLLDAEHGPVGDADLNLLIPLISSLGPEVWVKTASGSREYVQRALDFGADAVVIPHVAGVDDARLATSYGKYPPLGDRSLAAERAVGYGPLTAEWIARQDTATRCIVMVEDETGLAEVEAIAALPTVDGVMPGPSDLAIRRGRGLYSRTPEDFADLRRVAEACRAAGIPWILPAWAQSEREFALRHGASVMIVASEYAALQAGLAGVLKDVAALPAVV